MRHAIVTAINAKYGDFFVNDWYKSLNENVELKNIDIVVLDYGLTAEQRRAVKNVKFVPCHFDGNITSLRYRDLNKFLQENKYDQILLVDSGDLIFQADISHLFNENKDSIRAVVEKYTLKNEFIYKSKIKKDYIADVKKTLEHHKVINGGFILASRENFLVLIKDYLDLAINLESYGTDQLGINYLLYKKGFVELDEKYNFLIMSHLAKDFYIRKGKFYKSNNELIHVVHNGGGNEYIRAIKNFGYKSTNNKWNLSTYLYKPSIATTVNKVFRLIDKTTSGLKRDKRRTNIEK